MPSNTVTTPNFLFIGGDRVGSKWLHFVCRQHPEIFVPQIADPYFFDIKIATVTGSPELYKSRGLDWYFSLFSAATPAHKAIGELSHDYIFSELAAERIKNDLPDVKIIATVRQPIDRTMSVYCAALMYGEISCSFEEALGKYEFLIENGRYAKHLKRYFDRFDHNQIKVLLYDKLIERPREYAAEFFDFLGVPFQEGIEYESITNPRARPRNFLFRVTGQYSAKIMRHLGMMDTFGRLQQSNFLRPIFYTPFKSHERNEITPEAFKRLQDVFAPEIDELEALLGWDLTKWREWSPGGNNGGSGPSTHSQL